MRCSELRALPFSSGASAVVRPAQSRAVLPAMKPGTARAFATHRRTHSRAPGPGVAELGSLGVMRTPVEHPIVDGELWKISRSDLRGAVHAFTQLQTREHGSAPNICRVYVSGRDFVSFFFHTSGNRPRWQSLSRIGGIWRISDRLTITPSDLTHGERELMKRLTNRCSQPLAAPTPRVTL
jgi:hypothetical protein